MFVSVQNFWIFGSVLTAPALCGNDVTVAAAPRAGARPRHRPFGQVLADANAALTHVERAGAPADRAVDDVVRVEMAAAVPGAVRPVASSNLESAPRPLGASGAAAASGEVVSGQAGDPLDGPRPDGGWGLPRDNKAYLQHFDSRRARLQPILDWYGGYARVANIHVYKRKDEPRPGRLFSDDIVLLIFRTPEAARAAHGVRPPLLTGAYAIGPVHSMTETILRNRCALGECDCPLGQEARASRAAE